MVRQGSSAQRNEYLQEVSVRRNPYLVEYGERQGRRMQGAQRTNPARQGRRIMQDGAAQTDRLDSGRRRPNPYRQERADRRYREDRFQDAGADDVQEWEISAYPGERRQTRPGENRTGRGRQQAQDFSEEYGDLEPVRRGASGRTGNDRAAGRRPRAASDWEETGYGTAGSRPVSGRRETGYRAPADRTESDFRPVTRKPRQKSGSVSYDLLPEPRRTPGSRLPGSEGTRSAAGRNSGNRSTVNRNMENRNTANQNPGNRGAAARRAAQLRRKKRALMQRMLLGAWAACILLFAVFFAVRSHMASAAEGKAEDAAAVSGEIDESLSAKQSSGAFVQGLPAEKFAQHPEWTEDLLTPNEYSRPGNPLETVNNIFVHYTANPGTSAAQNRSYFEWQKDTHEASVSAHFVIGYEGEIIQCVPLDEIAYAVMTRNYDSISIECCYLEADGSFTQATYDSLISLLAWLVDVYDLDSEDILRHYDCGGKKCPLYYTEHEDAWEQLKKDVDNL